MHASANPIITFKNFMLNFDNKELINKPFTFNVYAKQKIAIIGRNGSGKSSILEAIANFNNRFDGDVIIAKGNNLGYIPQLIIENNDNLSGGQRFNQRLSNIMTNQLDILLLDEPTNHLDHNNRQSLFGFIKRFAGTLIIATHDLELLDYMDTIWHIYNQGINSFNGNYSDYITTHEKSLANLNYEISKLKLDKKTSHAKLMIEQQRAKKKKIHGEKKYNGDKLALRSAQGRGEQTANKYNARINYDKNVLNQALKGMYIPETITPKFYLPIECTNSSKNLLSITDGNIGYNTDKFIISNINLQLTSVNKVALTGGNGSGKSTLIRAIMQNAIIKKIGDWKLPDARHIGYVDQFYSNLEPNLNAIEILQQLVPQWKQADIREHLNKFLLRKNEEVNLPTKYLSGGEKLRLSLALIAAKTPRLLLLDEITNNVDLETKEHLLQVLNSFPGAMILICHEHGFIQRLLIDAVYSLKNGSLNLA